MNATDLSILHDRIVLVCSQLDQRNPPTGRRGTLFVDEDGDGRQVVSVVIDFPEMFTSRAHRRRIRLNERQIEQLLRREYRGAYTLTLPDPLDPELVPGNE